MFAAAFHTSRHYILFTAMACLCVLLGGLSYAAGADSLFIAGATYYEPGVSGTGWAWTDADHLELNGYSGEAIGADDDLVVTLTGQFAVDASWLDALGADGGIACLGGSLASARLVAPAGGAFGAGGVVDAEGSVAAHVTIEPAGATAPAGETGGPNVPGDGPSVPGTDPATGEQAADPSTNPTLKPAAATKTVTTTAVTNTTAAKAFRPKAASATFSSLPKTGDNCWIAASLTFFLLGIALLCAAIRC